MPPELESPYFPSEIDYIWNWFEKFQMTRQRSLGVSPISYSEILAWSKLMDIKPEPWEVDAIKRIDSVYIVVNSQ